MAIIINDELKENFEKFCNKNFPKKSFESNKKKPSENWFYVQVGKYYYDNLHCEYRYDKKTQTNNIELHIEFDNEQITNRFCHFLLQEIDSKIKNEIKSTKPNYKWFVLVHKSKLKNSKDLFKTMKKLINKIEEKLNEINDYLDFAKDF